MKVAFRVDASLKMGTGHIVRCLTLAKGLHEKYGTECFFICRKHPGHLNNKIQKEGFNVIALPENSKQYQPNPEDLAHASWLGCDWQTDAAQVRPILEKIKPDCLIVDHYALDNRWEYELRLCYSTLMVIDDLDDRKHICDLLLDQNLLVEKSKRYEGKLPEHCIKLIGPSNALLQPLYGKLHKQAKPRQLPVKRLLIFFGGADNDNLTGKTLTALQNLECPDISVDVVMSKSSSFLKIIQDQIKFQENVHLYCDLPSLAPLILKADLAIGAGGATTWERLCLGLPSIVISTSENQRPVARDLHKLGLVQWIGHVDEVNIEKIESELEQNFSTQNLHKWSKRCLKECSGDGTTIVLEKLISICETRNT